MAPSPCGWLFPDEQALASAGFVLSPPRRRDLRHLVLAFGVAAATAFAGLAALRASADAEREPARDRAALIVEGGAEWAADRAEDLLTWVRSLHDLGARFWSFTIQGDPQAAQAIGDYLIAVTESARLPVRQVTILDTEGWLRWSTRQGWAGLDASYRDYFIAHRAGHAGPLVSGVRTGLSTGRPTVHITRPILEHGALLGVVVVALDPTQLLRDLGNASLPPGGSVALLRTDGAVLARTAGKQPDGSCGLGPDLLAEASSPERDDARSCSDNTGETFVALRDVPGYPLHAIAAAPLSAIEGGDARSPVPLLLAVLAGSAALGAGTLVLLTLFARRRERREAAAMLAAQRRIADLLAVLPGAAYRGIVRADGGFASLYLSPGIQRITGHPPAAFAGEDKLGWLMEPATTATEAHFFLGVQRTGDQTREYRLHTAAGSWVWVREQCRLLQHAPDGSSEVVGLIAEITAERELRAKAIASSRLATLGEMAAGIAHELNQPATSIAVASDVAAMEIEAADPPRLASARRRMEEIARQIMRMRDIVDHLRAFSRPDEGGAEQASLRDAVKGAVALAGGSLHAAGVRIQMDVAPELPPVRGRLSALEQVLVNLLGNARDAMAATPTEHRVVEIAARHDRPAREVWIAVRDRGAGLPPGVAERVFEPFFTTKPVGEGTGLGLSIAHGTIRGVGGSITIANREGGGAEVLIRIPEAD